MLDGGGQPNTEEGGEKSKDEQGGDGEYPFDKGACILGKREHDEGDQAEEEKVDHAQAEGAPRCEVEAGLSLGDAVGEECANDEEVGGKGDGQQEDGEGEAKDVGHIFSYLESASYVPRSSMLAYLQEQSPALQKLFRLISQQQAVSEDPENGNDGKGDEESRQFNGVGWEIGKLVIG